MTGVSKHKSANKYMWDMKNSIVIYAHLICMWGIDILNIVCRVFTVHGAQAHSSASCCLNQTGGFPVAAQTLSFVINHVSAGVLPVTGRLITRNQCKERLLEDWRGLTRVSCCIAVQIHCCHLCWQVDSGATCYYVLYFFLLPSNIWQIFFIWTSCCFLPAGGNFAFNCVLYWIIDCKLKSQRSFLKVASFFEYLQW